MEFTHSGTPVKRGRIYRTLDSVTAGVSITFTPGSIVRVVDIYGNRIDCELIFGDLRMPVASLVIDTYVVLGRELEEINPEEETMST